MSEVATDDCEGCDEERPVQQLQEVRLPSGHTAVCCPDCRYHAEKLLEGATRACDGCGTEVDAESLQATPLTDGRKLDLCPDCVAEASTIYETEQSSGTNAGTAGSGGGGTTTASSDAGHSSDARESDTRGATTDSVGSGGDAAGTGAATGSGETADDGRAATDDKPDDEADDAANDGSDDGGRTGKPATTDDVCDQCGELFSIELYKVKTVDGRTEQFCPDCKEEGVHEGIVRDVELRRAQAYEVLELDGGADDDEIRQAYLRRVKEVHPDRADGNRSEFMLVQEAYERLSEE